MTWAPCPHGVRTRGKKNVSTGATWSTDQSAIHLGTRAHRTLSLKASIGLRAHFLRNPLAQGVLAQTRGKSR